MFDTNRLSLRWGLRFPVHVHIRLIRMGQTCVEADQIVRVWGILFVLEAFCVLSGGHVMRSAEPA